MQLKRKMERNLQKKQILNSKTMEVADKNIRGSSNKTKKGMTRININSSPLFTSVSKMLFLALFSLRTAKCRLVFCFVYLKLILWMSFFVFIEQQVIKYRVKANRPTQRDITCKIKLAFSNLSWKPELRKLTVSDVTMKTWNPKISFRIISTKCIPLGSLDLSQRGEKGSLLIITIMRTFRKRRATINNVSKLLVKYRDDMPYFPNQLKLFFVFSRNYRPP